MSALALLVATRKGLWILRPDAARQRVDLDGPHFLGHVLHHAVLDPRDRRTLLVAARTGHLGPTVFRSTDFGKSWTEATAPPAFPKAREGETGARRRSRVLAGARPRERAGLLVRGHLARGPLPHRGRRRELVVRHRLQRPPAQRRVDDRPGDLGTPDGPILHSIQIDPRDPRHLYLAMSGIGGGVFESRDGGGDWKPLNKGCVDQLRAGSRSRVRSRSALRAPPPARSRTCSTSRTTAASTACDRPERRWVRIGDNMPKDVGDIGFPIELHPRDPKTAWVFPMDGTDVWPRTSPGGKPAAYVTRDAGESWTASGSRPAARAGVVHRAAPGDGARRARSRRRLLRHHQRRSLGQRERRRRAGAVSRATCR